MYEFVLVNLYTKISEKKICIRLGFQPGTNMACIVAARGTPPPRLLH
jgi:hypothetical protein